jgi:hypothetical protein
VKKLKNRENPQEPPSQLVDYQWADFEILAASQFFHTF